MHTLGIICGSARRQEPAEMVIRRTCAQTGASCRVVRILDPSEVAGCDRLVIAPTGTLSAAYADLAQGMADALLCHVKAGKPCLGISLGMLVMFRGSATAAGARGLGLLDGECRALPATVQPMTGAPARIPHAGWNRLMLEPGCHRVLSAAGRSGTWMYFCHDEYAVVTDKSAIAATTEFGGETVAAAVQKDNVIGTLFKPERSHRAGIRLMVAFLDQP